MIGNEVAAHHTHAKRLDIEGLRAIAVSLVVVYHLWPGVLPGGFVGVDVFFVVSGFLITSHLLDAARRHGRVRLLDFWGRRARRLLPAAIVVLAATWAASLLLLPATQLTATAHQVRASALYFQNWLLARDSIDYLHAGGAASPVQHFWSLSVEEQFYLGWPLLFVAAWGVARLMRRDLTRRVVVVLAVAVVAASLWYSVTLTAANPAAAYFVTPTRVWELGLGGLLAMLPATFTDRVGRWGSLAWVGLAAVVGSAVALSGASAFPGWLALVPVGGAALLLLSGTAAARRGTARFTSVRPMVFVGGISYSLYLWHWPVVVLWQAWSGRSVGVVAGFAIVAASVALAWATKRWVEDPVRRARFVVRSPFRSLSLATAALLPVLLVAVWLSGQRGPSGSLDDEHPGAAALAGATVPATAYIPELTKLAADTPKGLSTSCEARLTEATVRACTLGDTTAPVLTVALVGDSHAAQWSDALDAIGKERHWKLIVATKGGCPFTATEVAIVGQKQAYTSCTTWNTAVLARLLGDFDPDVVITSDRSYNAVLPSTKADSSSLTEIADGMAARWRTLEAAGIAVVAIHETPEPHTVLSDCLAGRGGSASSCVVDRAKAFASVSPVSAAAAQLGGSVPVIDLTSRLCTATTCLGVIGNVVVYLDNHHLTSTYTLSLRPYLETALLAASDDLAAV